MVNHGGVVLTVGAEPPAMSISWAPPLGPADSGYIVIFSEFEPGDETAPLPVCLDCLLADGDEQLGRGLDLAREHGQVDWDAEAGEWFVPERV